MKIVIASDSFKESLSSEKVNTIIENTIKQYNQDIDVVKVAIADGGEGTVDAVTSSVPSEIREITITDALGNGKLDAKWALINNGDDAILEVASVVGLNLIPPYLRNPFYTTTYGIGEMIRHIAQTGVKNIYIGLGGSSTNDGAAGALQALGVKLLDSNSMEITGGGYYLSQLKRIDITSIEQSLKNISFTLLSDVENILCGKEGASYIFAPQKGATMEQVDILDKALLNFQNIIKADIHKDVSSLRGGGAAGGIGAGFHVFLNAQIKSGINSILELIEFDKIIYDADLIITGEGKIDNQTKYGKAISGIASYAKKMNKPVIAVSALLEGNKEEIKNDVGLKEIYHVVDKTVTKEMSIANPEKHLSDCISRNIANFIY
jgi:glycerate 2-kinase